MMRRVAASAAILAVVGLAVMGRELYTPYAGYTGSQVLVIAPHMHAPAIARLLVERGVLRHRWPFLIWYRLRRPRHTLKAGEYVFDRPLTPLEVYRKLEHGDVYFHSVVVPEGSDRFEIARIVQQQLGMTPEEFLRVTQQADLVHDFDDKSPTLEGYLFPDTYRFPRGVSAAAVATAMLSRFRRVLDSDLGREVRQSPHGLHEVMTLASLIEKETSDPAERSLIAGVFARRLKQRWPLQCDPTVVYAARLNHRFIGGSPGPITRRDLKFDSGYNTYRHAGLPPGPICNPGEASIRAAINPASGKFLYFVSNNHGGHLFARTLAEHQRNVARYRRQVATFRRGTPESKRSAE